MPQITVNEIDQSVVTRVVSDDKVKILCPIISSFGPGYDGTDTSIGTFTDITDFDRAYGYTEAEFNPFQNDYSRLYARELIKRGAAVSVVRLNNNGETSEFGIDGFVQDRTTPSGATVCLAATRSAEFYQDLVSVEGAASFANIPVPGTINITVEGNVFSDDGNIYTDGQGNKIGYVYKSQTSTVPDQKIATITYGQPTTIQFETSITGTIDYSYIPTNLAYKYTFCPQIDSITAKYPGSFGNNLALVISQVNTSRLAESYQYASISVYYINKETNYESNTIIGQTVVSGTVVNSVTLLENKLISTNPSDSNYFEDVEFEFIRIIPVEGARNQLSLVWSNINTNPASNLQYSGFPVIPLKYKAPGTSFTQYNLANLFTENYGTDFEYSSDVLDKLKTGYKGYWSGSGASDWSVQDVNNYLEQVYGSDTVTGIIPTIYTSLGSIYDGFTDPYIYDFDFITSSGFVYEQFELVPVKKEETITPLSPIAITGTVTLTAQVQPGSIKGTATIDGESVSVTDSPTSGAATEGTVFAGTTEIGTINYMTGSLVSNVPQTVTTPVISQYTSLVNDTDKPKVAQPTYPSPTSEDYAEYTSVTPIHQSMINLVESRQDCIALFDVPRNYDRQGIVEYSRLLNTSYGTIHHPWCWINSPVVANKQILMAPSYIFLYTFLSNLIDNTDSQKWFPPAGVTRATARVVQRPDYEISSVILNDWQNDNTSRVNPIMKLKQYGYVIYGQYTTLEAIDLFTHSALESLNVRLIANVVKKKIFDACLNLAFEPNTQTLWLKFYAQMDEYLRYMKYNQGLYDYRIVMDESTVTTGDINHLRCPGKVFIAPTRTAEFFDIDFIITGAGAIFSDS